MTELLIAIGIWCGNVALPTGFSEERRFSKNVNECREKLVSCIEAKKLWSHIADQNEILKCFKESKL